MPSDPTGTHPSGVLVRNAPDFFDDNVAYGGFAAPQVSGDNWLLCSLYNNALAGIRLKVYVVSGANDGGDGFSAWVDKGVPLGTLVGACNFIDPTLGQSYGQIYQDIQHTAGGLPNPFTVPPTAAFFGCQGFDSATYVFPFPMFVVPVGFALHIVNNTGAALLGASFWFHQANE